MRSGRDCCERVDPTFLAAHNDPMNLYPAVGHVNGQCSNYNRRRVSRGETYGRCEIVTDCETHSAQQPAAVRYDDQTLTVNGYTPDRDPIIQGKAQAGWLRELLEESTGKRFAVRSLVVYPGWYVTSTARTFGLDVRVLNPKGLPGLLEKLPQTLPAEDIKLASYHLSRYARSKRS